MSTGQYQDLRVVMIGAGFAAGAHLRALRQMGARVTAVVTAHPQRRQAALSMFPEAAVDWPAPEALRRGADLAIVASPSDTHLDLVREAATRGVDVIVEQPLDARLDRAEELVRLAPRTAIGPAGRLPHPTQPPRQR